MPTRHSLIVLVLFAAIFCFFPNTFSQAQVSPLFVPATDSPFAANGTRPSTLATGDFNRDGYLDVVTSNYNETDRGISILLGDGTGRLTFLSSTIPGPASAYGIVAVDFNRDGLLDVATIGGDPRFRTLYIFLGDGNGGLTTPINYSYPISPYNPISIVSADFNSDGLPDLALGSNSLPGYVLIFLNQGDANFAPATGSPIAAGAPGGVFNLTTADFNRDGKQDIATANYSRSISVLLGDGTGGFVLTPDSPINTGIAYPSAVAAADFNGDSFPDVAVSDNWEFASGVAVLAGNGLGGLTPLPGSPFSSGAGPAFFVTTGDFNNDGRSDLATANTLGDSTSILLNTGSGFTPDLNSPFATGSDEPRMVAIGDFDENGSPDLAISHFMGNTVSILINQTIVSTPTPIPTATDLPTATSFPTATLLAAQTSVPTAAPTGVLPQELPNTGETPQYAAQFRYAAIIAVILIVFGGLGLALRSRQAK